MRRRINRPQFELPQRFHGTDGVRVLGSQRLQTHRDHRLKMLAGLVVSARGDEGGRQIVLGLDSARTVGLMILNKQVERILQQIGRRIRSARE